jgi:hypothetical protein
MPRFMLSFLLPLALSTFACRHHAGPRSPLLRAESELGCPRHAIILERQEGETFWLQGCGRRVAVVCTRKGCVAPQPAQSVDAVTYAPSAASDGEPDAGSTFDRDDARRALAAVPYKDCGAGGPAKVELVFAPDGRVSRVGIIEGALAAEVATCVSIRFAGARMRPFRGDPRPVRWTIELDGAAADPPPPRGTRSPGMPGATSTDEPKGGTSM